VLEGEGIVEARSYRRRCNLTNFLDNHLDEAHFAFTHAVGFARIPEIPRVRISLTEFTAVSHSFRPDRVDRISEFLMPNILRFKSTAPYEGVNWGDAVSWRVPLDDETKLSFMISRFVATKDGEEAFHAREKQLRELLVPDVDGLAKRILAGELPYDEAMEEMGEHDPRYDITLQDHLTMGGKGLSRTARLKCWVAPTWELQRSAICGMSNSKASAYTARTRSGSSPHRRS